MKLVNIYLSTRTVVAVLSLALSVATGYCTDVEQTPVKREILIVNPMTTWDAADPCVLEHEGVLYLYSTGIARNKGFFPIRTSAADDRTSWTQIGSVFPEDAPPTWTSGRSGFWAPEVHKVGEQFICYFSARNTQNRFCIGAATAEHPAGPFRPLPQPIAENPDVGLIDVSFFQDPQTTRCYLFWKEDSNDLRPQLPTNIVLQEVAADGVTSSGEPVVLLKNDCEWEDVLVEAPSILYRDGFYYLFYSGNVFSVDGYNTGVARSKAVTGPYEKFGGNPILKHDERFSGPGHQHPFEESPGKWTLFYHARDKTRTRGATMRLLMSDPITWSPDGWPAVNDGTPGTTWTLSLP